MTSASEFEAALCQLEDDPPDIREHNANIREERWTHFSLEGVRFPALTVDVIQHGEALAVFERSDYTLSTDIKSRRSVCSCLIGRGEEST